MIAGVRGVLRAVDPGSDSGAVIEVDVDGVGYEIVVGARCAECLPTLGDHIDLAVYTYVREGAITLFGFPDRDERRLFSLIISAHGVGPALGVAILGALTPGALIRAVTSGDVDSLTLVPGVGKKTAQRLVIELAERFGAVELVPSVSSGPNHDGDLREALVSLGYDSEDIRAALGMIAEEGSLEHRLRLALRELAPSASTR